MKKRFFSMFLCVLLMFSAVSFTVNAQESTEFCEFEYIKRDTSTGDGYVIVEFADQKVTLSGDRDTTQIPKGENVTVTIKAELGSAITAVVYDGGPLGFGDPAQELNMTIENFKADHSLKITYETQTYTCSVKSSGCGSVSIIEPQTDRTSVVLPVGENLMFYAEAEEGFEITDITVNGEPVDLTKYGQTDVIKITRFQMELPAISEDTEVFVTFSGEDKAEYVNLTIDWNEGGVCNKGNKTAQVIKGDMYAVSIEPEFGYRVKKITDGDKVTENFTGSVYYATDVNSDRKITVEFELIEYKLFGDVNSDGKVNVVDATLIQKSVAGLTTFNAEQSLYGDVDGDSRITVKDATAVQKHTAGIITSFPVENR